ncbi:hypothetical protein Tco_0672920 [Tanacetum coccineum]
MTLPSRNERHAWLRFDTQDYTKEGIQDFESRLGKIYNRQVHQVQFLDFDVLTEDMKLDMTERLTMEHTDAQGYVLFTIPYRRIETEVREPLRRLCHRLIAFTIAGRDQTPEKVRGLTTIDIDELIRLRICKRLRDVVTWVALRLHRQQVGAAGEATQVDPKALLKEDGG